MSFYVRTPVGRIVTRFSSAYGNIFRMFGGPLAEFIAIIFDLAMMVLLISIAHPLFLFFIGVGSVFYYLIYRSHRDVLRLERRELSRSRSPSIAHFAETAQGASSIRTYLRQSAIIKRFELQNSYFLSQKRTTVKKLTLFSLQMNGVTALVMAATGISSYFLLKNGALGIGAIGVALPHVGTDNANRIACRGTWEAIASSIMSGRIPWAGLPKCADCHTFVAEVDTGSALYRAGTAHNGLSCAACHGTAHAQIPSNKLADHYQFLQYQANALPLGSCRVCHETSKGGGWRV